MPVLTGVMIVALGAILSLLGWVLWQVREQTDQLRRIAEVLGTVNPEAAHRLDRKMAATATRVSVKDKWNDNYNGDLEDF